MSIMREREKVILRGEDFLSFGKACERWLRNAVDKREVSGE